MFKVITDVATEPITRAEAKLHLRIDDISGSHPDDTLVDALITAARQFGEQYTRRAFAPQTLEMTLDAFPCGNIVLDMGPVASVTHIKYTDYDGVEQTVATSDYALSTYGLSDTIALAYNETWPTARAQRDAVRIRYVTGYAATGAGAGNTVLPKPARQGMLLMIGHWYEQREAVNIGDIVNELPLAARALLDTIKIHGRFQ
jgi:uncharacterized phiE125 gp8 family phage protein